MPPDPATRASLSRLNTQALALSVTMIGLIAVSGAVVHALLQSGPGFVLRASGLFLLALLAFARYLPEHLPHADLGPANRVTLARLALTALVAGCLAESDVAFAWLASGTAAVALLLDGVDGWLARQRQCASAFGARFDMETDALLILLLAVLVWQFDKAGAWIVLAGLARYAFVAASLILPWLRAPLPPSLRRKVVCVVQAASLLLALVPAIPATVSTWIALSGLLALAWSFFVDVAWLHRHARHHSSNPS